MINVIDGPWSQFCSDQKEAHSPPSTSLSSKNCTDMQKRISQNEVQIHLLKSQILQLCRDNLTNSPCILLFLYLQKVKSVAQIKARASEHHKEETLSPLRSLSPTPFIHLHPAEGAFPHSQHTARKYTNSVVEKELVEKVCCPVTLKLESDLPVFI